MERIIDSPGSARVDAHFESLTVATDQPAQGGGEGLASTPIALFLASIGTCAGIYVLGFCKQRNLPTDGIRTIERIPRGTESRMVQNIDLEIQVPSSFPA